MEFNNSRKSFFLMASLRPDFCCLSFPDRFHRAKKNSIDLFPSIVLKKVVEVRQYNNERSFSFVLESGLVLLFKMHGNRANIVLFENAAATELFQNQYTADLKISLEEIDRSIDWSRHFFELHSQDLKERYFTFGKEVWNFLNDRGFETADPEGRWNLLRETSEKLEHPKFFIEKRKQKLALTLLPAEADTPPLDDPIAAVTRFYNEYQKSFGFSSAQAVILKRLELQLRSSQSFLVKNIKKRDDLQADVQYQRWGDLIMANLDKINPGMEKAILSSFDDGTPVTVPLKRELNAQRNAALYYRKGKNRPIEISKLNEAIRAKEIEIGKIQHQREVIQKLTTLDGLEETSKEIESAGKRKDEKKSLPYREFECKGFRIWVGKDAKSNDELTLKFSFKDDLWLHAKDVAGSHVLIKHQAGKNFPKDVIERAAELAAFYSRRKNDSLCPVALTPKKYVRKRKGDPAGAVVVEREKVILVNARS